MQLKRPLGAVVVACVILAIAPMRAARDEGVSSKTGLVVCTSAPACDAGAAVLARGGNAVDAAVATAFALAVTHPSAGNIGGGGFMIVRTPEGKTAAFDYREKAPAKSTRTMYLDQDGKIDRSLTAEGYLAPGVPGTVRGLARAHRRFGKLAWKDVVMPAVDLAEQGFVISDALARSLNGQLAGAMGHFQASVEAYGKPGGGTWSGGDRLVLTDLAKTLRSIALDGPDAFYKGWIADAIAEDMKAHGGLITKADLAAYQAKERKPLRGHYRGYEVISVPPPSSGGILLLEALNVLESYGLAAKGRDSAETLHLEIEAMRRAYLDRARYLGDPDFVRVPIAKLTSKKYAKTLVATIEPSRATSSIELGKDIVTVATATEPDETTHFSVVDRDGMAVANTYTLEGGFGPGETNIQGDIGTPPNLIDPGKRMLSSMTPAIVVKDGTVVLITGSPGGRTIPNSVLSVVLGVTTFNMNVREAVDAFRIHHQWLPDRVQIEQDGASDETVQQLRAMGHTVTVQGRQGDANSIVLDSAGVAWGANDRRSPDGKVSVPGEARLTSTAGRH
ncbi:MAG: gamma-glutamyltransferase [Acidobacteria bacterium]|nr:MAG: gamma-glutamyltransferase [Acidobacteriota bacterium]